MGSILVHVLAQQVLHGDGVEHDGGGSLDVRTLTAGVVDVAEDARLCRLREMEVGDLDARYRGLFFLDPGFLALV